MYINILLANCSGKVRAFVYISMQMKDQNSFCCVKLSIYIVLIKSSVSCFEKNSSNRIYR